MKRFSVVSLCVLAALALSTNGASIGGVRSNYKIEFLITRRTRIPTDDAVSDETSDETYDENSVKEFLELLATRGPSIVGEIFKSGQETPTHPQSETEFDATTDELCCQIGDVGLLMPIVANDTGPIRRQAIDAMIETAERCSEVPTTPSPEFAQLANEILKSDSGSLNASSQHSCNIVDYLPLFPILIDGTESQKATVVDVMVKNKNLCNLESRISGTAFPYCVAGNAKKWGLYIQWMFGHIMSKLVSNMQSAFDQA